MQRLTKSSISVEMLEKTLKRVREAQAVFATYSQEQVDKIFRAAAIAANKQRIPLAKWRSKRPAWAWSKIRLSKTTMRRNIFTTLTKNTKTCGVVEEDKAYGIKKIAEPIGVVAAVIPTTNPTLNGDF